MTDRRRYIYQRTKSKFWNKARLSNSLLLISSQFEYEIDNAKSVPRSRSNEPVRTRLQSVWPRFPYWARWPGVQRAGCFLFCQPFTPGPWDLLFMATIFIDHVIYEYDNILSCSWLISRCKFLTKDMSRTPICFRLFWFLASTIVAFTTLNGRSWHLRLPHL